MFEKVINPLFGLETYRQVHDRSWTDELGNPVEGAKMGDRFYDQQLRATGAAPGSKTHPPKTKTSDQIRHYRGLPSVFTTDGFDKLTLEDLSTLADYIAKPTRLVSHFKPEDKVRLKAPWVECISQVTGLAIGWDKLTIANIKTFYAYVTQGME